VGTDAWKTAGHPGKRADAMERAMRLEWVVGTQLPLGAGEVRTLVTQVAGVGGAVGTVCISRL
jgi:hypothetical protein